MNNFVGFIVGFSVVFVVVVFILSVVVIQRGRRAWEAANITDQLSRSQVRSDKEVVDLTGQLSRCQVRSGNLEEECQRLAWGAFNQLKSLKIDLEARSGYFTRQMRETPHKDHEERATGYREASATIGQMIEEMERRGSGKQKIEVDLSESGTAA